MPDAPLAPDARDAAPDEAGDAARHAAKMAKIKAARDRMMAEKTGRRP